MFRVPLAPQRYPDAARRIAFFQELLPRIGSTPGVEAVAVNSGLHPLGNMWMPAEVVGYPPSAIRCRRTMSARATPKALGIRLAAGRLLTDGDVESAQRVALVNERFVRTRIPDRPPLGQVVKLLAAKDPPFNVANHSFQIVGVVHDTPNAGLTEPTMPEIYLPFSVTGHLEPGDGADLWRSRRRDAFGRQPGLCRRRGAAGHERATSTQLLKDEEFATPRFNLVLLSVFAIVGLALAVVGVYGVMSNAVAQERQEIGVRMALGADAGTIARMILARGVAAAARGNGDRPARQRRRGPMAGRRGVARQRSWIPWPSPRWPRC